MSRTANTLARWLLSAAALACGACQTIDPNHEFNLAVNRSISRLRADFERTGDRLQVWTLQGLATGRRAVVVAPQSAVSRTTATIDSTRRLGESIADEAVVFPRTTAGTAQEVADSGLVRLAHLSRPTEWDIEPFNVDETIQKFNRAIRGIPRALGLDREVLSDRETLGEATDLEPGPRRTWFERILQRFPL